MGSNETLNQKQSEKFFQKKLKCNCRLSIVSILQTDLSNVIIPLNKAKKKTITPIYIATSTKGICPK
jgi:hypothetical protein